MDESRAGYQKLLTDISVERLSDQIDYESICRSVDQFINGLTQREQMIIRTRYCLQAEKFKTLQQIGDIFGVTRERIRQIERKALRKLKAQARRDKIFMRQS
mgnify:CR=1 FL=1